MATTSIAGSALDALSAGELLAAAGTARRDEDAAAARILLVAAAWADRHPPETVTDRAVFSGPGCDHAEPVAGPGCPDVAEFCLAELGAALGTSTAAATRLVGHALELRHRLPRLWARVHAGDVPAWRARRVAEATIHARPELSADAAGWVDAQVSWMAERIGVAQLDRVVAEAILRSGPDRPTEDPDDLDPPSPDTRDVRIEPEEVSWHGTVHLAAELDLADALDLDHAVRVGAAELAVLGSDESLGARRARALGHLARHQLALDLAGSGRIGAGVIELGTGEGEVGAQLRTRSAGHAASGPPGDALPAARQLVLHVHLSAAALSVTPTYQDAPPPALDPVGRLEEGQRLVVLDEVRRWCRDYHTRVVVRPVLDLGAEIGHDGYRPTMRQREQVMLRDRRCLFPWCSRPARRCDIDHVVPFDHRAGAEGRAQPGPTTSSNLVALCRRHHRLKTHAAWRVSVLAPGTLVWTSPHGHRFWCDADGTTRIEEPPAAAPPAAAPPAAAPVRRR